MALNDVFRVQVRYANNRQGGSWHMFYRQISAIPAAGDSQPLSNAFSFKAKTPILNVLSSECFLTELLTYRVNSPGIPGQTSYSSEVGLNAPGALPSNKANVFSLLQDETDAKHNGRIYVGGMTEGDTDGNVFTALYLGTAALGLGNVLAAKVDNGTPALGEYEPVVLSHQDLPFDPLNVHPVTSIVAKPQVYSQRRRTGKSNIILV